MSLITKRSVVLINPLYRENWEYIKDNPAAVLPLGILSIGTVLVKEGFNVKIIDACTNPNYINEIKEAILDHPLFIGISAMTAHLHSALQICRLIRQIDKDSIIPIVWGGVHPTIFPENTARNPYVDMVVTGMGEYSCLKLAQELSSNSRPQLSKIAGIAFCNDKEFIQTAPGEFININNLPFINYDLIDIEKYIYRSWGYGDEAKKRSFIIYTGAGCPFRCAFCASVVLHKRRYSGKNAQRVLAELDFFTKRYDVEDISFCDDLFFVNKSRIEEFIDGLLERDYKIHWYANIRADCFRPNFISEGLIKKMKQSGCIRLGMGCESGSQKILDEVLKKDIKIEYVLEAARLCSKYDITVGYSFMMGLPEETKNDVLKTIGLMKKIKKLHPKCFFFGPQVYIPFPGSELYQQAVRLGFRDPKDLEEWASVEVNKSLQSRLSGEYLWNSFDPTKLPWVKDIQLVRHIDFMQNFIFRDFRTIKFDFKYPIKVCLVFIARFRIRFRFWRFPAEYWLYCFLVSFKIKNKKMK